MDIGSLTGYLELDGSGFDSGLQDAEGSLQGFSRTGVVIAAAAGVAIAGALGAAVVQSMNVEAANDQLAAQLRLTEGESAAIGATAGKLYAGAYGSNLEEVNSALRGLLTNVDGLSADSGEALEGMGAKALDLAKIMGEDVAAVTRGVGQLMRNGMAPDAEAAFDMIAAASALTGETMQGELLETIEEYGVDFKELGLTGEQAMGAITAAVDAGARNLDVAADTFREFSDIITEGGDKPAEALKDIGLNADEMRAAIAEGGPAAAQATSDIIRALAGVDDQILQNEAGVALFGTKWLDVGKDAVFAMDPLASSLQNVDGALDGMSATLNGNAMTSLTSLRRQLELAVVALGNHLLPALSTATAFLAANFAPALAAIAAVLTGSVIPAVVAVAGFITDNQSAFTVVAGIITAVFLPALVAMGLGALASGVQVVTGWVMAQAAGIAALAVHSATIVATVGGWALMGAQALFHAAKVAAAWLIAIGPIGLVIAAVVGLVVLVIKNWDTIRNATVAVWNAVAGAVSSAASSVASFVSGMVSSVLGFIGRLSALPGEAARHFGGMLTSATSKAGELLSYVGGLPGKIISALGNLGSLLLSAGGNLIGGFISGIRSRAGDIIATIRSTITDKLPGFVKSALGISSPSKVFAAIGADTGMGMVVGLQSMGPKIQGAMAGAIHVPSMPSLGGLNVPTYQAGDPTYGGAVPQGRQAIFQIEKVVVSNGRTFHEEMALAEALYSPRLV